MGGGKGTRGKSFRKKVRANRWLLGTTKGRGQLHDQVGGAGVPKVILCTIRVWTRLNLVKQLHIANVVDVNLLFQDDDQPPPVQLDTQDRRGECQFADRGLSFRVDDL